MLPFHAGSSLLLVPCCPSGEKPHRTLTFRPAASACQGGCLRARSWGALVLLQLLVMRLTAVPGRVRPSHHMPPPSLCRPPAGGLLRLRELHRGHRGQRAHAFPFQPGDRDDPCGLHDVRGRRLPHDDPALQTGLEHAAFRAAGKVFRAPWTAFCPKLSLSWSQLCCPQVAFASSLFSWVVVGRVFPS